MWQLGGTNGWEGPLWLDWLQGGEVPSHTVRRLERVKSSIGNGMGVYPLTGHQHLHSVQGRRTGVVCTRHQHAASSECATHHLGAADGVQLSTLTRHQNCIQLLLLASPLRRGALVPAHYKWKHARVHNTDRIPAGRRDRSLSSCWI